MSLADANAQTTTEDVKAWLVSAKAEFAGFTASIGYSDSGNSGQSKLPTLSNNDISNYAAALKYTTGPYQVGVSYAHAMAGGGTSAIAAANTSDFTADTFTLGAQYTLGAGLVVYADTWYYTNDSDGAFTTSENSAIGLMLGTRATF
jgi:predicted porin